MTNITSIPTIKPTISDEEKLSALWHHMVFEEEEEHDFVQDVYDDEWLEETDDLNLHEQGFMRGYLAV
ncbi:hypothetical protein HYY69_06270 [Candidatus Woesearchaeota archaeon]|nr:hypothetical protein [Candidatus Woesearchaeota archaeon]